MRFDLPRMADVRKTRCPNNDHWTAVPLIAHIVLKAGLRKSRQSRRFVTDLWLRARRTGRQHARSLMGLFSVSFFCNLTNFAVTSLLVVFTPASLFATYLVAQSVSLLTQSFADGGLSTAGRIIASKERPDAILIVSLQRVLNRYSIFLAGLAFVIIAVLAGAFSSFDRTSGVRVSFGLLMLSAAIGVIQARGAMWAALIYSGGQFRPYYWTVLAPSVSRFVVVSILLLLNVDITLPILLANDFSSSVVAWLYSTIWLRRLRGEARVRGALIGVPALSRQVHQLLRSGMVPAFLEGIALQSVVLAGGAFGSGVAVATFGVFVRAIQIIKVVIDPLITYGQRYLRLAAAPRRRRAEASLLAAVAGSYSLIAASVIFLYMLAGSFFHHYALGHTFELTFCLASTLAAFIYLCLDSILLSRGYSNFRLVGTILQVATASLVVLIMHPASLWQLVLFNAIISMPRFVFYSWFYWQRLSEPTEWSLWVPETVEQVASSERV